MNSPLRLRLVLRRLWRHIIWALLDGFTTVVIGSGLYLYVARWRKTGPRRVYPAIDGYGAKT
jgi:hypothetical protein